MSMKEILTEALTLLSQNKVAQGWLKEGKIEKIVNAIMLTKGWK